MLALPACCPKWFPEMMRKRADKYVVEVKASWCTPTAVRRAGEGEEVMRPGIRLDSSGGEADTTTLWQW